MATVAATDATFDAEVKDSEIPVVCLLYTSDAADE
mgnify:CR=1 FL=1